MEFNAVAVSVLIINILIKVTFVFARVDLLTYENLRNSVIQAEELLVTGGDLRLSAKEANINNLLIKAKLNDLSEGFRNSNEDAAALHFFKAKPLIERSKIFKLLRRMPKGAILHVHNSASVSSEWVVKYISYMPGLLRCINRAGVHILTFRQAPEAHGCATQYVRISDERRATPNASLYDFNFEKLINLQTPTPEVDYPTLDSVWSKFQRMFKSTWDALHYLPVYRAYHWQMLQEMYDDNVMYAEVRMSFGELYDVNDERLPVERSVEELQNIIFEFRKQHPDFLGIKAIFAAQRGANRNRVLEKFNKFKMLHNKYPTFIIGFDLVGQEDHGNSLQYFVEELNNLPTTARYFFHAGETNRYRSSTDLNLIDAILMNTTRIGHGYALAKHPLLMSAVKNRDIAIEVSPISNQVLHLVSDMRNHPASVFMSQDLPIVICNDDPGFWNAKGLSYDFYYALMSLAPNDAGLKTLKTLAWNSIRYSVLTEAERRAAFYILQQDWNRFLDDAFKILAF